MDEDEDEDEEIEWIEWPTSLYRFFSLAGELLYVGITAAGGGRWSQHGRYQPWWPEVATAAIEHFPTRREALRAESRAIRTERPRYQPGRRSARALRWSQRRRDERSHASRAGRNDGGNPLRPDRLPGSLRWPSRGPSALRADAHQVPVHAPVQVGHRPELGCTGSRLAR